MRPGRGIFSTVTCRRAATLCARTARRATATRAAAGISSTTAAARVATTTAGISATTTAARVATTATAATLSECGRRRHNERKRKAESEN